MKNNELRKYEDGIIRILDKQQNRMFIIDCISQTMPKWINETEIAMYQPCSERELMEKTDTYVQDMESLDAESRKFIYSHFSLISSILPFVTNTEKRSQMISMIADERGISKVTLRHYLCLYLIYQDISVFCPKKREIKKELSLDEKNIRWALNKFYYTKYKNTLKTAYTLMLKEKYCDGTGALLAEYPSFDKFKYYYRKNKSMQTYYISRDGLKSYQRNNRPLLGDGVQQFAPNIGVGMLDATICDIYLVDDGGNLVGRPILTACIDANSSLCCGYSLSWSGGTYSLRDLMLNIVTNKVEHCRKYGICINKEDWDCDKLPGTFVTDMGSEYKSQTFEQIADLGVTVINLPAYRPELKGAVEKFFDVVQESYKKFLKGKGVIEPDFQERGARDYRKDACLTLKDFEKIVLHCIIYYNSQRVMENYPFSEIMLGENVKPYANEVWNYGKEQMGANLISVTQQKLMYVLLPRATGKFTRKGLKVNGMRYHCDGFTDQYLKGGEVTVAYNPEDTSKVWVIDNGKYIAFEIIESRFKGRSVTEVELIKEKQKTLVKAEKENNTQAQIDLARHIEAIANNVCCQSDVRIKDIRKTRKREQQRTHKDFLKGGVVNG